MTKDEAIERLQARIAEDLSVLMGLTRAYRIELELRDEKDALVMHVIAELGPGAIECEPS